MREFRSTRRGLLGLGAVGALAFGLGGQAQAAKLATRVRIVIIGAGAGGATLANRLVQRLDGASITLVDPRREHLYQPGLSLVAAGLKPADYVLSQTTDWLPQGVTLIEEAAAAIDPQAKTVSTESGQRLDYDFLVVAPGLVLDHAAIEGFSLDMVGQNGIGALYAGPQYAAKTWEAAHEFTEEGGIGLFTRPATEMKCAGAPLKYAFVTDDVLRRRGNRGKAELIYNAHARTLFSVPIVAEKVRMLYQDRGIRVNHDHVLRAIDPGRRIATFRTPQGDAEQRYDFINVVPPMRAPQVVRNSPLPWQSGPFAADGWAEVDRHTLRHVRFPEVFCIGDVAGVPKGKTAASVKWQVPVMVDHLVAATQGRQGTARYDGYTSCPLITRIGRAMLVEFDYNDNLVPSFPGVIAPLEELWITWIMKEVGLKPTYLAMLRGRA